MQNALVEKASDTEVKITVTAPHTEVVPLSVLKMRSHIFQERIDSYTALKASTDAQIAQAEGLGVFNTVEEAQAAARSVDQAQVNQPA